MSPDIKDLIEYGVEYLDNIMSSAGCNDITFPDTPEMRAAYHEYSLTNCPEATGPEHDQYQEPHKRSDGRLGGYDGFVIYLMRREMGLLT